MPTERVTTTAEAGGDGVTAPSTRRLRRAATLNAEQFPVAVLTAAPGATALKTHACDREVLTAVTATHDSGTCRAHAKPRRSRTPTGGSSTTSPPTPVTTTDTGSGEGHSWGVGVAELAAAAIDIVLGRLLGVDDWAAEPCRDGDLLKLPEEPAIEK